MRRGIRSRGINKPISGRTIRGRTYASPRPAVKRARPAAAKPKWGGSLLKKRAALQKKGIATPRKPVWSGRKPSTLKGVVGGNLKGVTRPPNRASLKGPTSLPPRYGGRR
jgi:hypothetical protein